MLRVVAEFADVWNAFGAIGTADEAAVLEAIAQQVQTVDAATRSIA